MSTAFRLGPPWAVCCLCERRISTCAIGSCSAARRTQELSTADGLPLPPATPFPTVNHVQLLDAYVGCNSRLADFIREGRACGGARLKAGR